jgi:hypothetical protein
MLLLQDRSWWGLLVIAFAGAAKPLNVDLMQCKYLSTHAGALTEHVLENIPPNIGLPDTKLPGIGSICEVPVTGIK